MTNGPHSLLPAISDATSRPLTTQQIGRLGELLVQYELLRCGIDSAPMTTDAGVDLVAYSGVKGRSITLQVKTNLAPKPGGGKGAPAVDWWVSEDCPAELCVCGSFESTDLDIDQAGTGICRTTAFQRPPPPLHVHGFRIRFHCLLAPRRRPVLRVSL